MNEFDLIRRYFCRTQFHPQLVLGPGDDAALTQVPPTTELVSSMDTLVGGVHIEPQLDAESIAYKAIMVNLSDCAAMGAQPHSCLLSLTVPSVDHDWLSSFSQTLFAVLEAYHLPLIGGDLSCGPLSVTVAINGLVPSGQALLRSAAGDGDQLYVTGVLGNAAVAWQQTMVPVPGICLQALNRPTARVREGMALRGHATAAMDISDGLLIDANRMAEASGVGIVIEAHRVPRTYASLEQAMSGGDDYELLFTMPAGASLPMGLAATCIGSVHTEYEGVKCYDQQGNELLFPIQGYQHFT